jgi:hypothetical protein
LILESAILSGKFLAKLVDLDAREECRPEGSDGFGEFMMHDELKVPLGVGIWDAKRAAVEFLTGPSVGVHKLKSDGLAKFTPEFAILSVRTVVGTGEVLMVTITMVAMVTNEIGTTT